MPTRKPTRQPKRQRSIPAEVERGSKEKIQELEKTIKSKEDLIRQLDAVQEDLRKSSGDKDKCIKSLTSELVHTQIQLSDTQRNLATTEAQRDTWMGAHRDVVEGILDRMPS